MLKTTDFISKLETIKDKSKDSILFTLDIRPLYTNIHTDKDIEAVKEVLNNQTSKSIATQVIIKFFKYINHKDCFYLMVSIILRLKVVQWAQHMLLHMPNVS